METSGLLRLPHGAGDEKIQAHRRRLVAALRIRGLTIFEIIDALEHSDPPCVNPETGEPWSKSVISKDLIALKEEWREDARRDTAELLDEELARNKEAERLAWQQEDIAGILRAQKQRCDLLGLNAPVKVAPTTPEGDSLSINITNLNFEQLQILQSIGLLNAPAQPVPASEPAAG